MISGGTKTNTTTTRQTWQESESNFAVDATKKHKVTNHFATPGSAVSFREASTKNIRRINPSSSNSNNADTFRGDAFGGVGPFGNQYEQSIQLDDTRLLLNAGRTLNQSR